MRKQFFFTNILFFLIMLSTLGCNKKITTQDSGIKTVDLLNDPFQSLTELSNEITKAGGIASIGIGISRSKDIAKKKAIANAMGNLDAIFNIKVEKLNKILQKEKGVTNNSSDLNKAFSSITRTLTRATLHGAVTKKVKFLYNKKTDQFTAVVVVAIDQNTLNKSINQLQLFLRFRDLKCYGAMVNSRSEFIDFRKNILDIFLKIYDGQIFTKDELFKKLKQTYTKSNKHVDKNFISEQINYLMKKHKIKKVSQNLFKIQQ